MNRTQEILRNVGIPLALAAGIGGTACSSSESFRPNANTSVAPTTVGGAAPAEGLPGTVKDGSDAAIAADVDSGLTNCGGLGGAELWTDKPYNPDHMMSYYKANPDMVQETQDFWTGVMGSDALSFITQSAKSNNDANKSLSTGNAFMDAFTQKHIANTDVPQGTVEKNHNCVDKTGDGKADTIEFLDLRVAQHGDKSVEGEKRTTLAGLVLSVDDYNKFAQLMVAGGKNPEDLIHYEIDLDLNNNTQIEANEKFVFVATSSAICENPVLKGELPPITVTSTPPSMPPVTVTIPRPTTTTPRPTTPTTRRPNKNPAEDQSNNQESPNVAPGSGGESGDTGVTSTTAAPVHEGPAPTIAEPNPTIPTEPYEG